MLMISLIDNIKLFYPPPRQTVKTPLESDDVKSVLGTDMKHKSRNDHDDVYCSKSLVNNSTKSSPGLLNLDCYKLPERISGIIWNYLLLMIWNRVFNCKCPPDEEMGNESRLRFETKHWPFGKLSEFFTPNARNNSNIHKRQK